MDIFGNLIDVVTSNVIEIAAVAVVGYLTKLARDWFGIDIEKKRADALEKALVRASKRALNNVTDAGHSQIDGDWVVSYAKRFVPQAISYFGLTDGDLATRADAEIEAQKREAKVK